MRTTRTPRRTDGHVRIHPADPLPRNPNRDATRDKGLHLPPDWSQCITIERRRRRRTRPHQRDRSGAGRPPTPPRFESLLVCPACAARVRKMFLPLATQAEADDAASAARWLAAIDDCGQCVHRPLPVEVLHRRAALIRRYGPLLPTGRQLRCRHCWRIRYGET